MTRAAATEQVVLELPTAAKAAPPAVPHALALRWLATVCQQIPGAERGIVLLDVDPSVARNPTARWPSDAQTTPELIAAAEHAFTQTAPVVHAHDGAKGEQWVSIACPVSVFGQSRGVVVVRVSGLAEHQRKVVIQILQWGSTWLELLLEQRSAPAATRLPALLEGLEGAFEPRRFVPVALAVASHLAHHLDFERVSLGLLRRRSVELIALSDSPSVSRRTSFAQALEQAMAEARDAESAVLHQQPFASGGIAHQALAKEGDALAICSVPLRSAGRPFAVLTFERVADRPLDAESTQLCIAVAAALGPMLDLKRMQDRPWWSRGGDALVGPTRARRTTLRRVGLLLLLLTGVALISVTDGEYRVAAPATVEGRVQRAVVAPFDGFVELASVRAGDRVTRGMTLAQLDDDPIVLEQRKWSSQREELVKQYRRALAGRERAESRVLEARVGQADAELELLTAQLKRTVLRAPFDGVVVSGDLSRALGAPVTRGQVLFEVAPLDDYRIVLQVDERDMRGLRVGLRGALALTGMPAERLPIMVQKIGTSAQDADGRNVVQLEARLAAKLDESASESAGALRPGMHGVAKITVGERRLLWIWTHALVDWARLALWSGLP